MKIINLTQHAATNDQMEAGVDNVINELKGSLTKMLTFNTLPTKEELAARAAKLTVFVSSVWPVEGGDIYRHAMIDGPSFFMAPLEAALKERGITPLYAFSVRESVEATEPDGSVVKTNVFKHVGFVEA